ncbi:9241_t:CDS:2 [Funneliformis caledonium]|uniref:9241_t:CDS:1 n=1 Tax=Funneliformis caledonium TaxID=1117310 RepID=A0A9N8ZE33_9GLOM|nr:9241_t:CDS:2 [Funneliformis caledonium]
MTHMNNVKRLNYNNDEICRKAEGINDKVQLCISNKAIRLPRLSNALINASCK